MRVRVEQVSSLVFDDGMPVRAASAVAPFGDGWLVVQDDATHAAWVRAGSVTPVRVVPAVDGLEVFSSVAGTKHLKPDFEAAVAVPSGGVLLLGSGSTAVRTRVALVTAGEPVVADRPALYAAVADCLDLPAGQLNLEGACLVGGRMRWFQRGNLVAGVPSASVDVDLAALLGATEAGPSALSGVRRYDLGLARGVALSITDAVALPDGKVLVSAAAEDTPNAVDDGPVVGAALALLDDETVVAVAELPAVDGVVPKVEGLAVREILPDGVRLLAVVDVDDPLVPSRALEITLWW
ncbi:hypothetical protein M1L60_14070 [Actinoplanes sp. TRM 88003]|uniref:Uncharacterized protein n=1 Tax=Paractinoplanes aksuensis TaxID=2939490 RepID=A0ABT1DLK4_9ACTN|nr:hypothetical protein [Actinoplanes aksuensis]MCO8271719.1 hypothetical protein [Actinoplanes aksuensis]